MKIAIACDHGGYLLKQDILIWLEENNIDYEDFGCYSTESVDYPVFAERAARAAAAIFSRISATACRISSKFFSAI